MSNREQLNAILDQMPPVEAEQIASALIAQIEALVRDEQIEAGQRARTGKATWTGVDLEPFPVQKRVAGLSKGAFNLADDFDAPLPDAFWLGEE